MLPPNSVAYVGGVGDDKYAAILRDAVRQAGLRVEYRVDPKVSTGRCGVVITGHNRSMCTDLGAANHYDVEHLKRPEVWALVKGAEAYYVGGYHFTVCPPAIMELCREAAAGNKPLILSLSAPFIPQFFKDPLDEAMPYTDYVIGNETEAAAFAESHGFAADKTDLKAIAKAMANLPKENGKRKRVVIVTQGTEPTLVAVQGEDDIKEFPVHTIAKEQINDTNGAGDAFAGGFCAGIVDGKPLDVAIDMGQWLARLSIQELGPSYVKKKNLFFVFLSLSLSLEQDVIHVLLVIVSPLLANPSPPAQTLSGGDLGTMPKTATPLHIISLGGFSNRQFPRKTSKKSLRATTGGTTVCGKKKNKANDNNRYPFPKQTYQPTS